MKYFASLVAFCLLVGCSEKTSHKAESKAPSTAMEMGIIEVADGVKMLFDLGSGKTCSITPTFQKEGMVLLEMIVEENGKVVSRPRVLTSFDTGVSIFDGTTSVSFTARKKP
jgi:hypothetical protein